MDTCSTLNTHLVMKVPMFESTFSSHASCSKSTSGHCCFVAHCGFLFACLASISLETYPRKLLNNHIQRNDVFTAVGNYCISSLSHFSFWSVNTVVGTWMSFSALVAPISLGEASAPLYLSFRILFCWNKRLRSWFVALRGTTFDLQFVRIVKSVRNAYCK